MRHGLYPHTRILFPIVVLAASALTACSQSSQQSSASSSAAASASPGDWIVSGHDLSDNRAVSSTIDRSNVTQLAPAWTTQIADIGEQEAAPIVHDGIMYIATPHNSVLALDARTGALKWDSPYSPSQVLDFAVDRHSREKRSENHI